jgi:diguanylate cyclase (GGDEF)-like protein/PAS domain S-box-containing protein
MARRVRLVETSSHRLDEHRRSIASALPADGNGSRSRSPVSSASWLRRLDVVTPATVLVVGLPIVALLMVLTALNVAEQTVLWENGHWTAAGIVATLVAASAVRGTKGLERRLRQLIAAGAGCWLVGQLAWNFQLATGTLAFPGIPDAAWLATAGPVFVALILVVRGRMSRAQESTVYLDAAAIFLTITAVILQIFGEKLAPEGLLVGAVSLAYPVIHIATAGAGLIALFAAGAQPRLRGGYLVLGAFALLGYAWVEWLRLAPDSFPVPGSAANYLFSIAIVALGVGGATWRLHDPLGPRSRRVAAIAQAALPLLALLVSASLIVTRHLVDPRPGPVDVVALVAILLAGIRQTVLVIERGRVLDLVQNSRAELEVALLREQVADSRFQTLVEHMPAGVYIDVADSQVTDGGRLDYMSPQCGSILGYAPEAFVADPELWPRLMHPADRERTLAAYAEHWRTGDPLRVDYRMIARDGKTIWIHDEAYAMTDAEGRRVSQGLVIDTTDQKRLEAQLLHDALHDPLTGLANRVLFRDHVERALNGRRGGRKGVALLFLDVDDFKVVNDSLGHRAGDGLLSEVAQRIEATIRAGDVAARQGGDEFTILMAGVRTVEEATAAAERLASALRCPMEVEGRSLVIGVSIGIALANRREMLADDLLAHADAAMYAAKALGKARHAVFDPTMRVRARSRLEMESELRGAIDRGEFELHYQPIVDLASRKTVGFEALVRWRHQARGLVPPGEFIPLSEATGLIVPLGRLVTAEACRQLQAWRDAEPGFAGLTMSINVSSRQALEPGFVSDVRDVLAATGLEPSALTLEITESLMLDEATTSDSSLRQLRDMGIQIEVDDFGTGFSALQYFKRFAIDGLKIDRSFVSGLGSSREDTAIVTATLAFASALGLSVTAEGVETTDQLDRLQALGCRRAQGYLFAPPMSADIVPGFLYRSGVTSPGAASQATSSLSARESLRPWPSAP